MEERVMSMSGLREKLVAGKGAIGTHVSLIDSSVSELVASAGFDYIWIDMEHTCVDYQSLLCHLQAVRAGGGEAVVRVPADDFVTLKKVLEMGPEGVVFPMIRTVEQARALVEYTQYPPDGTRGFGPRRAIRYGLDDVNEYIRNASKELLRLIQIEHVDAVRLLPELLQIPGLDGCIIGPCDLSGSIGEINRVFDANTTKLISETVEQVKAAGKIVGLSYGGYDRETVAYWRGMGIDMLSVGSDLDYIAAGARKAFESLRAAYRDE